MIPLGRDNIKKNDEYLCFSSKTFVLGKPSSAVLGGGRDVRVVKADFQKKTNNL